MSGGGGAPGSQFRDYRIVEEVSRGGQGVVYKATHGTPARGLALKLLTDPQPAAVKRFKQEARVLSRLSHPNVLQVFEHGEHEGVPFLAVEYVDGQDLKAYVKAQGLPPPAGVARVMATVAHTIHYCHEQGVIHRDLKPDNVLIEKGSGRPVVIDFGLVKRDPNEMHLASLDQSVMSKSGSVKGTPEYMSPEQVNPSEFGEVGPRSDVYGLGATLYYLLTGQPPFKGGAVVVVFRKVTRKAPVDPRELNPAVPAPLAELCLRCLAKRSAERPESALALAGLLCEAAGIVVQAPSPRISGSQPRWLASSSGSHAALGASSGRHRVLPPKLPQPGEVFAGCTIERELGRGGAGAVYSGVRPDGRRVAIKVVLGNMTSAEKRERFMREAQVGHELDHPAVVKVHERGEERGLAFLIMDLVENARTLSDYVEEEQVSVPGRVQLMLQVAEALEAAHKVDLIHRDLKPDNVVVTPDGQVKVLDFGLARHLDKERLTMSGAVMGTVHYMAPEQVLGRAYEAGPATDVWAMGVMLFELVKRELPFEGSTNIEVMAGIVDSEPEDPCAGIADAPKGVSAVIRMCLAKDPKQRYVNAAAFGRDLVAATSGSGSISAQRVLAARDRKRLLGRLLAGVVVALLLVGGAVLAAQRFSKLGESELKERFAELDERARDLVKDAAPGLGEERVPAGALRVELEALLERAAGDPGAKRVAKLRARIYAVEGLAALAGGDSAAALAAAEGLGDAVIPEAGALRGGIAAVSSGDPADAVRLLSRAIARGLARPELRAWRLAATARQGIDTETVAERVITDARVLKGALGRLSSSQSASLARAHVALADFDAAEAVLATMDAPPTELLWRIGLARAEPFLEKQPKKALELLQALPGEPPAGLGESTFMVRVREQLGALIRGKSLEGSGDVKRRVCEVLVRLATRVVPANPLSPEERADLLKHTADYNAGDMNPAAHALCLALADALPEDREVQTRISYQVLYMSSVRARMLVPALKRAIRLTPSGEQRRKLELIQLFQLQQVTWAGVATRAEAELAVKLAGGLARRVDEGDQLASVFAARAGGRFLLGDYEAALEDVERASEAHERTIFHLYRALSLYELKRDLDRAFDEAVTFCNTQTRTDGLEKGMRLAYALRAGRSPARLASALESVLEALPHNGGWWVRLAQVQLELGKKAAATGSLEKALTGYEQADKLGFKHFHNFPKVTQGTKRVHGLLSSQNPQAKAVLDALVVDMERERQKHPSKMVP